MRLHNYWWLLIWPIMFGLFGIFVNMQRREVVDGEYCVRWKPLAAAVLAAPFVVWAGWRHGFGDTEVYRTTFSDLPTGLDQIIPYLKTVNKGPMFRLIELLFKNIISDSSIAFFLFVAAFQMVCLVYIYRKYSPDYWLSIFLFIASTDYLSWMHNGIRQFIAACLVFFCVPLLAKKRLVPCIIIVLFAATIHFTALIYLPLVFVVGGKSWNFRTLLFIAAVIIAVIFVDRITGFLTEALVDTAYEGDIEFLLKDDGTNIMRVLFYSVPAIMAFVFRPFLDRANDPFINVCVNLSVATAGFYVFSFFTSGVLMGAIPIYFSLSNYILIPWLIREIFSQRSATMVRITFLIVYTGFFIYQCGPTWGLL